MRIYKQLIYWLILFSGIFLGAVTAEAAPRPLTDLGYFHWANQSVTPAENTFIMHYNEALSVEPIEGNAYSTHIEVDRNTNKSKALVKNVGFYNGEPVNLLVTLERNKGNLDGGEIWFTKRDFLRIYIDGEMIATYEFLDKNNQPLELKTAFNYYGLNQNKYIGFVSPGTLIKGLYANNPTNIMYDVYDGGADDYWVYFKNPAGGGAWAVDPRQNFELTTNLVSSVKFVVHNNDATTSSIKYSTEFLANPEFPAAYGVQSSFAKANQDVYLKAQQTIPNIANWEKNNSISVAFDLQKMFATKQYSVKKARIVNFSGEDVTNLFSIDESSDGKVNFKVKDFNDARLYDTILFYYVDLTWNGANHPVDESFVKDGKLSLPFSVQTFRNGQKIGEHSGESFVNYMGKVTVAFLNEKDNILQPPFEKEGIITTHYDLSDKYPQIDGYTPIRNNKQDQGIFLPDEQMMVHRYKKGQPLKFDLLNKDNPLLISRFNNQRELTIKYSHDPSSEKPTTLSFVAKYQEEEKVIKEFPSAPKNGEAKMIFAFPEQWIGHEVSFYMKDNDGQGSNVETRVIEKEKGPSLSLPGKISFGEVHIPSRDKAVFPPTKDKAQIEDHSKLEKSRWTVKVKEEQPLTNEEKDVLAQRLIIKGDNTDLRINHAEQEIWQGSGSASFDLSKNLKLAVHPSDPVGSYQGSLRWTFEDAPD
ncbi:hypothetical protein [Enterococcus gallinarum]|uniref:WxL domain-containing protein n=1 Tax=Enterococcus gallinarum TaxID=1353 RepID=A0A376GXS6_ENTGA|nr:hypothetical protein [Enterococcus gallinarum]STD73160.1 Uncharacterised protein [Enterococcus gallinarum]STD82210.1 Uncharacterised protein [Enterococcus gallinarum]